MLTTDHDLRASEIQQLASADAMAGLFTALGYDTSQRIVQVPDAMGFPEALAREVVHMERMASHDDNALQVYLVELKHVTVALTQMIARVLKNRAGSFLFALTTRDYEDIDFVLFESLVPEHSKGNKFSSPQVVIRPRILSVDRHNPDAVSLRVLRRFSYTEIDAYYQWSLFDIPKIISQSMLSQKKLIATLDLEEKYVEQSLVCIVPYSDGEEYQTPKDISLGYILSIINSNLASFYFAKKIIGDSLGGGLIHATPGSQGLLPVRLIKFSTPAISRTDLKKQFQVLISNQKTQILLDFIGDRLSATPEQSDVVHDLLAHLAEQMIDLNKQKQSEMKRFLGWLEGLLKVNVDEMTGKSKLRNYIGNYQKGESEVSQAELEDIFYKNRNKLGISRSDARPMAKIRDEYEKSLAVLRPLKSRLAWTDGLID